MQERFALQLQDMTSRLQNLHSLFTHLNNAYSRLPLVNRRHLYGNHTQTAQEVRVLARAKFVLAATLQWLPPIWNYNVDNFAATMGRIQRKGETEIETEDEMCPIWLDFFKEMVELDRLLALGQEDLSPLTVDMLFATVERKCAWLYALNQVVLEEGGWEAMPNGVDLSVSMIFIGWNRFCFRAATVNGLDQAITTIRPTRKVEALNGEGELHAGKNGQREYFAITPVVDYQPWALFEDFGRGCGESDCIQTGGEGWHRQDPSVERYETPSYAAAYYSVEEAFEADQLFDGRVYKKNDESCDPGLVVPTAIKAADDTL